MIFTNILLAFQLENYQIKRSLRFLYKHPRFWIFGSKRQKLQYTQKAKLLLGISIWFFVLDILASIFITSGILLIFSLLASILSLPLYFAVSCIIVTPLDRYLKKRIIKKAKAKLDNFPHLKIIAITGSFWKTTTKEVLHTILSEKYNILSTQGTKNTPLGISRLILDELSLKHHVFIVEMWAYIKWDIKELCDFVWPNISILTGITLQHLERFKTLDNIIDAKFEILECLWPKDFAVVDTSTEWVQRWLAEKPLDIGEIQTVERGLPYSYKENLWGIIFHIDGKKYETKLLSNYILQTFEICLRVAEHLGMKHSDFATAVTKVDFVEHRMQLIHNTDTGVYVIDDSFNGNIEWIESILDLMARAPFTGRKILIAGWVVELGNKTEEVHLKLGRQMSRVADKILLVDGPVWNTLKKWLSDAWYTWVNIHTYKTPLELHEDLKNIIQKGDMVVFQNDLPDNYL